MADSHRTTLICFLTLLIITTAFTLWLIFPFLLSITMGGIVSLLLRPLFLKMVERHFGPKKSALLLTLGMGVLFIVPLTLLAVIAVKQGITIGHNLAENEKFSPHVLLSRINQWPPVNALFSDSGAFEAKTLEWMNSALGSASSGVLSIFSKVPSIIIQLLLAAISCFVFLLDGTKISVWMSDKIPLEIEVRQKLAKSFTDTAISTIWATFAAGAAQSIVMLIAFLSMGVPAPMLGAGLTFIFAWIPMVGCSPVWIVATVFLISKDLLLKAFFMVLFGLFAGIIDNIVRPMVLKGRSKIHPFVSIISIFGGIALFGIVGVFLGPVLASLMISLLILWAEVGARYGLIPKG